MGKFKSIKVLTITSLVLFVYASIVFSQVPFERGMNHPGGIASPPITVGEVQELSSKAVVILTRSGSKEELSITSRTFFAKESSVTRDQLRMGGNLFIVGRHSDEGIVYARIIRILDDADDLISRQRFSARAPGPEGFRGPTRIGGPRGRMEGPVIGEVIELTPLTIRKSSGETTVIEITEEAKLLKETLIDPAEIKKGTNVRVIAPPTPGLGSREAIKVTVLPEPGLSSRRESPMPHKAPPRSKEGLSILQTDQDLLSKRKLLPDLVQQPFNPDFIYGIWLGRGLYSNEELDRAFRVAKNLGIKYFKVEYKWGYVEPENNRWQWSNENTLDVNHVIELAKRYNLSIIPYFDTFMPWGEKRHLRPHNGECEGPPSRWGQFQAPDPGEYAEYIFTVVDRLIKGGVNVRYIELDNEVSNLNDGYHSYNCFINMTAKQIKEAENAAYHRVKSKYPFIMVSSTTFSFPGLGFGPIGNLEKDKRRRNSFIKAYFEDNPQPRFDFLGIHEVLSGSGNPYTTRSRPVDAGYEYNFGSYHDAYDMWRGILDKYGYKNKPIFNMESGAIFKGEQDVQMLQRAVFTRTNAYSNKVIGLIVSQLTGSRKFAERGRGGVLSVGITNLTSGYGLREGYFAYYTLMNILARYPNYEGKIMGNLNAKEAWIEKFSDTKGNALYVAFVPYQRGFTKAQIVPLRIGKNREARVTRCNTKTSLMKSDNNGYIALEITQRPIFVEMKE